MTEPALPLTPLRVLIVDDEALARARLRQLLADVLLPPAQVVAEAGQAAEALELLSRLGEGVDVLLLDIHMPGLNGLALAEKLRLQARRPALVFVTAHAEHALKAFEVEAVDYLTKPVRRLRLQEALARAAQWLGRRASAPAPVVAEEAVLLTQDGALLRVPLSQVLYLKAEGKQVHLRTATQWHVLDESLTELQPRLGERFVRVHRNAVVALQAISALARQPADAALNEGDDGQGEDAAAGWAVCVEPTREWLAVSRRQLPLLRRALARDGI